MPTNENADYVERSTMLRSLLGDYLDRVKEREFDLPFLLLLPELGFYDLHVTHGGVEFGKDFIAKRREDGVIIQYSFQTKAGNINQAAWEKVQQQMLTSVLTRLTHPNFDAAAPHKPVLVTTGDLTGNAGHLLRDLNREISDTYHKPPIELWAKQNLLDFLVEHGLTGMLRANAEGQVEYGRFLIIHGQSLQGTLSAHEIEEYARNWIRAPISLDRLLQSAIESELLAQRCTENGYWYEATCVLLAPIRLLGAAAYTGDAGDVTVAFEQAAARLHGHCVAFVAEFRKQWESVRSLLNLGNLDIVTYPVQCARLIEMASLAYFTTELHGARAEAAAFLADLIRHEPGCAHPISDQYAVTIVMATLVLCNDGQPELAGELLRNAAVWLCDRYQHGGGLAGIGANEADEIQHLLGSAAGSGEVPRPNSSFLATALSDLAAFVGEPTLYHNIVNDIKVCAIHPEYFGARDPAGQFGAAGENVAYFASVSYQDDLTDFDDFRFADHLAEETATFAFVDALGPAPAIMIMALSRDRYFPKLWPALAPNCRRSGT